MRPLRYRKDIIPDRRGKFNKKTFFFFLVVNLILLYGLTALVFGWLVYPWEVNSRAMVPGLKPGDRVWVWRSPDPEKLSRFDILLVRSPLTRPDQVDEAALYPVRLVGLPGEELAIREKKVFVNGQALVFPGKLNWVDSERFFPAGAGSDRDNMEAVRLAENQFFVLADNRELAFDSRHFGPVSPVHLAGRISPPETD